MAADPDTDRVLAHRLVKEMAASRDASERLTAALEKNGDRWAELTKEIRGLREELQEKFGPLLEDAVELLEQEDEDGG